MASIYSSPFGRLFGNRTQISITNNHLKVQLKGENTQIAWQDIISPPAFRNGVLGQTMSFSTKDIDYVLSKLSYHCAKEHQAVCQRLWSEIHQPRLHHLLKKIDFLISKQYLRQSVIQKIKGVVNTEYQRWYPWIQSSRLSSQTRLLGQRLSYYQHWKMEHITACREQYINQQLQRYCRFFDKVESNPLTTRQRRACIIDDDNNLLLAGAGTGKTSVMVGRAGYLLHSAQAKPEQLLLLAYGKKAADEMEQRIKEKLQTDKIGATTFHSLGLDIITQVEGKKPILSVFALDEKVKAKWVQNTFESLLKNNQQYCRLVLDYFSNYYYVEKNECDFNTLGEYYQYLNDNDVRTLKGELVKSFGELQIANWLFNHGITYQYEKNYKIDVADIDRKLYKPDFFLPGLNIYIEYYAIDENGETASYVDQEKYQQSVQWKREIHERNNTQCIELTFAQHKKRKLFTELQNKLQLNDVQYSRLPKELLLANLKESGHITTLAEMFAKLLSLYKAACFDEQNEKRVIANAVDAKQAKKVLLLLQPIVKHYQTTLAKNNEIDFDDMINKALEYVNNGLFKPKWRYIMVDEFQDISEPRARLVKALRDNNKGSSIFAVGDDWQAIYRFSGADVTLTTGFSNYFGATTQTELDETFRFNDKIGAVATAFIAKNPAQINKTIHSRVQVAQPAISILRRSAPHNTLENNSVIAEIENSAVNDVLNAIDKTKKATVYLLARFWFQLPNSETVALLNKQYPLLSIQSQSFHAAKGKEADYVIMLGLKSGKQGFPSTKATPAVLETLLAKEESFEYAEERRLFYVALTRAKHRVYLISDMADASLFVKELIDEHEIELNEFAISVNQKLLEKRRCLTCDSGILKLQHGRFGHFYCCSHFPRCDHKESACKQCATIMTKSKYVGFKACLNERCTELLPLCLQCGAEMTLRKNHQREFWGCTNFKGNDPLSCKQSIDKEKLTWPKQKLAH